MATGLVKWFSDQKGYGFVKVDGSTQELFVHHTDIISEQKFKTLKDNDRVEFVLGEGKKGPKAQQVRLIPA